MRYTQGVDDERPVTTHVQEGPAVVMGLFKIIFGTGKAKKRVNKKFGMTVTKQSLSPSNYVLAGEGLYRIGKTPNEPEERFAEVWNRASPGLVLIREHALEKYTRRNNTYWWLYFLDFAHEPTRTAIEIDGLYHDTPEQQQKDRNRDEKLANLREGWSVLHFKADEVLKDPEWCVSIVVLYIQTYYQQGVKYSRYELESLVRPPRWIQHSRQRLPKQQQRSKKTKRGLGAVLRWLFSR